MASRLDRRAGFDGAQLVHRHARRAAPVAAGPRRAAFWLMAVLSAAALAGDQAAAGQDGASTQVAPFVQALWHGRGARPHSLLGRQAPRQPG
jgi:hypothetical protein